MQISFNADTTAATVALAYRNDDSRKSNPAGRIIRITEILYRSEGYFTGCYVAEGSLEHCVKSLQDYGTGYSYGDPDTDHRLLSVW